MDIKSLLNLAKEKWLDRKAGINHGTMEHLLLSIALKFIDISPDKIDKTIVASLGTIADSVDADRGYIYLFKDKNEKLTLFHTFNQEDIKTKIPQHEQIDSEDFAWLVNNILENSIVRITSTKDLPTQASTIKAIMEVEKTQSFILCPLCSNKNVIGIIGLDYVRKKQQFSNNNIDYLLRSSGNIFINALNRKNTFKPGNRNDQLIRSLFSEIEDVIFISTPDDRFLEINPAGAKLLGYSSVEELMKLNIGQELYVNPNDRKEYKRIMKIKGHVKDYELTLKDKNGKNILVLETATVVRDKYGNITAYQGILRDITYKRQLEQQLFQAKKMESVGLLAGGIAHDFNNILTTISGYAELIQMDMDKSHQNYNDIDNIIKGVKRAENLIRQLLAFSRKQMIEPEVIDINELITELYAMLKRLISEDIQFKLKLKDALSYIKADPIQIQQILVNLIVNANHAIKIQKDKHKGKRINVITDEIILTRESTTQYPGSREGKYVNIEVQDSGIGMGDETKHNIFEPFFSTKNEGEGTGLGLATVYGIVKQNNGYIYVNSQPDMGTTFKIFWPVTDEQKTTESTLESKIEFQPHTETILFVEDDISVRELFCNALKSFGYDVIEAENGRHALEIVQNGSLDKKIDLVISDVVMPEIGGEELAGHLKERNPEIKILLCSGFTDSRISTDELSRKKGYFFLPKPYTIQKLEKTIRSVLSKPA